MSRHLTHVAAPIRSPTAMSRHLTHVAAAADATPPPSPPLTGFFLSGEVTFAAFDAAPAPIPAHLSHRGGNPGRKFAEFFHEPVAALASTRGLVCLRGTDTDAYFIANPATFKGEQLPPPAREHRANGEPQVVVAFESDPRDSDPEPGDAMEGKPFYRHYHVVVAFPLGDGGYAFESFSSRAWKWAVGDDVAGAEAIEPGSGVGILGCAFWRTSMGAVLFYDPLSRCSDLVAAPEQVTQCPYWTLGEMDGTLCVTCTDDRVKSVFVFRLDFGRRAAYGTVPWTLAGHFEGGCLRGCKDVKLLRSQGKAEVVMWDPSSETVVAMDIEGHTTRTIRLVPGSAYYADFIPYVWSLATVSAIELFESDHDNTPQKIGDPSAITIPLATPPFQRGRKGRNNPSKRDVKMMSSSSQGYSPEKHTAQRTTRRTQNNLPMLALPPTTPRCTWTAENTVDLCTFFLEEKSKDAEKPSNDAYQTIQRKLSAKGATYTMRQVKTKVTELEKKYKSRKDLNDPIEKDLQNLLDRMFGPNASVKNPTIASSTNGDKIVSKETEDEALFQEFQGLGTEVEKLSTGVEELAKVISSLVPIEQEIDIDSEKDEWLELAYDQALAAAKGDLGNIELLRSVRQARMAFTAALCRPD